MTVATLRTKAEQTLAQQIAAGGDRGPRAAAAKVFAQSGLPNRKLEAWKYTDLRAALTEALPLAKSGDALDDLALEALLGPLAQVPATVVLIVNGQFSRVVGKSGKDLRDEGVTVGSVAGAHDSDWSYSGGGADDPQLNLALALATDGAIVVVRTGAKIAEPIHLVFASLSREPASTAIRNDIVVGDGAEVTLFESHIGLADVRRQGHAVTRLNVGAAARVQHLQLIANAAHATQLNSWAVELGGDARYSAFQLTESPALARNQLFLTFNGEGANFTFDGAVLARGKSHVDTTMVIDHAVPRCTSREAIRCVLDGEARGIFQGKVIVRPDAQKSDGKQMAKALLLSPLAEFDSKPELEIYADDVICGHGSTAAEIDEDQVFYLMARGIPKPEARALLVEAFAGEAIDAIEDAGIGEALRHRLARWLQAANEGKS